MDDVDIRFFLAFLAPTLGFLVWFVKRLIDDEREERRRKKQQDSLVRALFAEIDFNTRDMERFLKRSPSEADLLKRFREDRALIPHITDARHTEIYRTRISAVHNIADGALHQTVNFYGLLEKIRVQIEGVQQASYLTLSPESRVKVIALIIESASDAAACGQELLGSLAHDHRSLGLERFRFDDSRSLAELSAQRIALEGKIDALKRGRQPS